MTRIRLTDLAVVRRLTEREQAEVRGGVTWGAVAGIAVAGFGIYKLGSYLNTQGYLEGIKRKIRELRRTALGLTSRRQSNCVTWYDGQRTCYA